MVRNIWGKTKTNAWGATSFPTRYLIPILALALLVVIALGGAQAADDLEIFVGQDKTTYEHFPLAFNDAEIIKPSPLDPERTYSFYWDFDSQLDSDLDGVRDNDNQSNDRYTEWTYHVRGKYLVTLTVGDGEVYVKDTLFVTVSIEDGRIEYILTDKREYVTGEEIEVTVPVSRASGPYDGPWLHIWEGMLVLETLDEHDEVIWDWVHPIEFTINEGNQTFLHTFIIDTPGDYIMMGTLTWDNRTRASEHNTSFRVTDAPDSPPPDDIIPARGTGSWTMIRSSRSWRCRCWWS